MRIILFRGKRVDNKEWIYGYLIGTSIDFKSSDTAFTTGIQVIETGAFSNGSFKGVYEIKPETTGQFIGLTDIKGNNIFEGDVLKDEFLNNYVIKYCNITATFRAFKCIENEINNLESIGHIMSYTGLFNNSDVTVIGNIHEK